jgi:hypothetical protein
MHCVAYGIAANRSSPILPPQVEQRPYVPASRRPRPRQWRQHLLRRAFERVVDLAVVRRGGRVSHVVVHRCLLGLLAQPSRVLGVDELERGHEPLPLVDQSLPVDGRVVAVMSSPKSCRGLLEGEPP